MTARLRPAASVPHRHSHRDLLRAVPGHDGASGIDALVVPTNRSVNNLPPAIALAADLGCPVVVFCSGRSRALDAARLLGGTSGVTVTLSSTPATPLLRFRTQRSLSGLAQPYLDTGNKRNVGILLGRMLGWQRLLFLDDDIRDLGAAQVGAAAAVVGRAAARMVGWLIEEFPDNSVVCHALRSSGAPQNVFIGAGALLVDLTGTTSFFPAVYNEDWLFWHDELARGEVAQAGSAYQTEGDPFADPHRAVQQEFGDVLAEGLYNLVHEHRSVLVGCLPIYWDAVIAGRRATLAQIDERLWRLRARQTHTDDGHEIGKVLRSVGAARHALELFNAQDLAEFTALWRIDLFTWNARLYQLPRFDKIAEALDWLGIADVHVSGAV